MMSRLLQVVRIRLSSTSGVSNSDNDFKVHCEDSGSWTAEFEGAGGSFQSRRNMLGTGVKDPASAVSFD
jgi:hypothetical protein